MILQFLLFRVVPMESKKTYHSSLSLSFSRRSESYNGASNFNALLTPLTFLVSYFNSAINPLLYAFLSRNFRKGMRELLLCSFKKPAKSEPVKQRPPVIVSNTPDFTHCSRSKLIHQFRHRRFAYISLLILRATAFVFQSNVRFLRHKIRIFATLLLSEQIESKS